jgi:hypothetical protein
MFTLESNMPVIKFIVRQSPDAEKIRDKYVADFVWKKDSRFGD